MAHLCDELQAFHDGELPAAEAEAFRAHLGGCARCEKGLLELMQLGALAAEVGAPAHVRPGDRAGDRGSDRHRDAGREATVVSLEARRKRRAAYVAAPALAAAAAVVVWLGVREPSAPTAGSGAPVAAAWALAQTRKSEMRVTWSDGDRHRPYDVQRSGGGPGGEDIALKALVGLEERGDYRALVGAHLLRRDDKQAEAALAKVAASPERDSDRAALLLSRGQAAEALAAADLALGARAHLGPALWNRALALRDLGLPLAAAEAFEAVSARGEAGWADEARARAEQLRGEALGTAASWQRLQAAKEALFVEGTPLPDELVAAHPAPVRLMFYNALRVAPSRERTLLLLPLAKSLDGRFGGTTLTDEVYRVAATDFAARAPLAAAFLPIATLGVFPTVDEAAALLARIDRAPKSAGARDLRLGVLVMTDLGDERPADVARAAAASGDAWFADVPAMRAAARLSSQGEIAAAERALSTAIAACKVELRCMVLEHALGELLSVHRHRPVAARQHYTRALQRARRLGDWDQETKEIISIGQSAQLRGETAVASAFYREGLLRANLGSNEALRCNKQRWLGVQRAALAIDGLRFDEARLAVAEVPRCGDWVDLQDLLIVADLVRFGVDAALVKQTHADIDRLRGEAAGQAGMLAILDYFDGRLRVAGDVAAARPLLERAIATADKAAADDILAQKARTYASSTLIVLDASAGKYPEALAGFAREARVAAPARCGLGLLFDDERIVVAARLADGRAAGAIDLRGGPDVDMTTLVPQAILEGLRACEQIDVLAFAPIHGKPVLPPELPWSFVGPGAGAGVAGPGGAAGAGAAPPGRRVIIADPVPPAELDLPRLSEWPGAGVGAEVTRVTGAAATPGRVIEELRHASDIEIHAHGVVNSSEDTSMLVLSPDGDGRYSLSARDLAGVNFEAAPMVILAACETTEIAPYLHERWSLPDAFVSSGARAVLASGVPIPDSQAGRFFEGFRARLNRGISIARALSEERTAWLEKDAQSWVRHVVVFQAVNATVP